MPNETRRKLRIATIVYWFLLFYIIAALVWWSFSLLQQNKEIHELKKATVPTTAENYTSEGVSVSRSLHPVHQRQYGPAKGLFDLS